MPNRSSHIRIKLEHSLNLGTHCYCKCFHQASYLYLMSTLGIEPEEGRREQIMMNSN